MSLVCLKFYIRVWQHDDPDQSSFFASMKVLWSSKDNKQLLATTCDCFSKVYNARIVCNTMSIGNEIDKELLLIW
jgi:hypothetical protein